MNNEHQLFARYSLRHFSVLLRMNVHLSRSGGSLNFKCYCMCAHLYPVDKLWVPGAQEDNHQQKAHGQPDADPHPSLSPRGAAVAAVEVEVCRDTQAHPSHHEEHLAIQRRRRQGEGAREKQSSARAGKDSGGAGRGTRKEGGHGAREAQEVNLPSCPPFLQVDGLSSNKKEATAHTYILDPPESFPPGDLDAQATKCQNVCGVHLRTPKPLPVPKTMEKVVGDRSRG